MNRQKIMANRRRDIIIIVGCTFWRLSVVTAGQEALAILRGFVILTLPALPA